MVEGNQLALGQISVIRGAAPMVEKASQIGLGRFSAPGQKVVLDRPTILSRLASNGISSDQVRLTGADAVTVRRQQQIIEVEDFVEIGQQFLDKLASSQSVSENIAVAKPKDLVLSRQPDDLQLKPQLVRGSTRGHVTVRVQVIADGQDIGTRDVSFRLKYRAHRIVATQQITEGATLTPENIAIETVVSDQPESPGWKPPYGLVATRTVAARAEIRDSMVGAAQTSVMVHRNETVLIRIERPGILVTAMGTAIQEGQTGEYIKVRNADSYRVIVCKVMPDGSVEPVL
jgi:flagella basal body P-ring formation protein FlgA